jgi:hypothetical protein
MAPKSQSGVSIPDRGTAEMMAPTPFQEMLRTMAMVATAEQEENRFAGDDLNAILSAETEEEMWEADERGPLNFQHLAGCEIAIIDLSVKFSRNSNASIVTPFVTEDPRTGDKRKMYFLVTAVRLSDAGEKKIIRLPKVGEVFQANTSARYVSAKLWWFYSKGMIDSNAGGQVECLVEETDLGDETAVLKLKRVPRRVVTSTVA